MRVAVIGCGTVSNYGHIPTSLELPDFTLIGVCDTDEQRLTDTAARHGLRPDQLFRDYRALIRRVDVDAVVIATPLGSHAEITKEAAAAGKHVLCEKPLAHTDEAGLEMIEACKQAGVILAVNLNLRLSDVEGQAKVWLEQGLIGNLRVIREIYNWHAHQWRDRRRIDTFMAGGGPMIDSGVHFMDICRWFAGEDLILDGATGTLVPDYDVPIHVISLGHTASGIAWTVEVGWLYTYRAHERQAHRRLDLIGDRGTISFDYDWGTIRAYLPNETLSLPARGDKNFGAVYMAFRHAIETGDYGQLATGEDAWHATRSARLALQAATAHAGAVQHGA